MSTDCRVVRKVLTSNDTGDTGSHQAGIHIPKNEELLSFFPVLDSGVKNPRIVIKFVDKETEERWPLSYIYYNSKLFGGTRNEYRLTGISHYVRARNLHQGNEICFEKKGDFDYFISCTKASPVDADGSIVLSKVWKIVSIKGGKHV